MPTCCARSLTASTKAHAGVFDQEADRVAVRAAAEAVIELLARADREARRLLAVERAQAHEVGAALLELDVAADDLDDVDAGQQARAENWAESLGPVYRPASKAPPAGGAAVDAPARRLRRRSPRASCPRPAPPSASSRLQAAAAPGFAGGLVAVLRGDLGSRLGAALARRARRGRRCSGHVRPSATSPWQSRRSAARAPLPRSASRSPPSAPAVPSDSLMIFTPQRCEHDPKYLGRKPVTYSTSPRHYIPVRSVRSDRQRYFREARADARLCNVAQSAGGT